jgi:hypothetical protein
MRKQIKKYNQKESTPTKNKSSLKFVNLGTYTSPVISEEQNKNFVQYGQDNDYYGYLLDLFNGSPTNSAAINGIAQLIAGRGLDATDSSKKPNDYAVMKKLFSNETLSRLAIDLKLFGGCSMQVIYNQDRTKIVQVEHYPVETLRAEKCNEDGEIEAYYYAADWNDVRTSDDLKRIPAYGFSDEDIEILFVKPYKSGYYYYSPVDYQGGTQYIEMESEISNFHLNSLKNGMNPSLLLNMNSGVPDEDTQREIENKIYSKYVGTSNSGRFILAFNNSADEAATVETIQLSDAHQQYQFLSTESSQKIIISHRITSPLLLGINKESGLGSNADELKNASILFDNSIIRPFQDLILRAFDEVLAYNEISLNLYIKTLQPLEFIDLENATTVEEVEEQTGQKKEFKSDVSELKVIDGKEAYNTIEEAENRANALGCMGYHEHIEDDGTKWFMPCQNHTDLDKEDSTPELTEEVKEAVLNRLLEIGEDEDLENYELIDSRPSNEYDKQLHNTFNFASAVRSTPNKKSDQDTSIIKVRYVYAGSSVGEREFCNDMLNASKVYRIEDLDSDNPNFNGNGASEKVNKTLQHNKSTPYNIFLYKGGVNCKHFFERRTYLKKNNKRITVNEARRLIIAIDPSLRDEARIEANPREVAQIADSSNDYWKY